jgi:hypothetical protein
VTWHFFSQAGPPPLPDWSILSQVSPPVAFGILATVIVIVLAWVLGPALRERISKKPDPPPPSSPSPSPVAALPGAVDTASETSKLFIDHLVAQLAAEEQDHKRTRDDLEEARRQIVTLQGETQRLQMMLWQRGPQ